MKIQRLQRCFGRRLALDLPQRRLRDRPHRPPRPSRRHHRDWRG